MDYQNYDAYIRNTLGFSGMEPPRMWQNPSCNLEALYPDSYRVVYPMVVSVCSNVSMPITEDLLNRLTDDIYDMAIADGRINIEPDVPTKNREDSNSRQVANRPPRINRRNSIFRDLIKILLLRELIGRRQFPPRF